LTTADPNLQIVTALTGNEGVRRAEVMLPDLVLLDYSLPDLRGDQVCERLLQNETTARIPLVMMSGHISEMAATALKYPNLVATIAKPFMSEALIALVDETLTKGPLPPRAPIPQGNGKKPAKKNGTAVAKPIVEKPAAPAPPAPQPAIASASLFATPETTLPQSQPSPATPVMQITGQQWMPASAVAQPWPTPVPPAGLATANGSSVVLGLGMEVIAIQFTPRFQIGTIRARPTASTLSLTHSSAPTENLLSGFEIGMVELDAHGRIQTMRVVPTRQPAKRIEARSGFAINDISLVNQSASIQITASPSAPMTMQLMAMFKVASVELSDRFEVAQLVLHPAGTRVRVVLDPQSRSVGGTEFETVQVRLDASRRIAEFVLNPANPQRLL
jgi:CheY-like chemotaxis protein